MNADTSPNVESPVAADPPRAIPAFAEWNARPDPTMTGDIRSDTDVSTAAEFNAALTELLDSAHDASVDVQGAWACRTGDGGPDWEAAIVELDDGD